MSENVHSYLTAIFADPLKHQTPTEILLSNNDLDIALNRKKIISKSSQATNHLMSPKTFSVYLDLGVDCYSDSARCSEVASSSKCFLIGNLRLG